MAERFRLLVETTRPVVPATLPTGRMIGCVFCLAILKDIVWVYPEDQSTPEDAPSAWCSACAIRIHLVVLRADEADDAERTWTPPVEPEPEMVTVLIGDGIEVRVPRAAVTLMQGAT